MWSKPRRSGRSRVVRACDVGDGLVLTSGVVGRMHWVRVVGGVGVVVVVGLPRENYDNEYVFVLESVLYFQTHSASA